MIRLVFMGPQRETIRFEIEKRVVYYFDKHWTKGIQIMPKNQNTIERLRRSYDMNLKMMAALIMDANKGDNQKEYIACKNDQEVAKLIRKDCGTRGLREI